MKLLISCVFFLTSAIVFSQKGTSLTTKEYLELQDKARGYINSNIDSAFVVSDRMEKSENIIHKVFAIGAKSYLFQLKGDSLKSRQYYKLANDLAQKLPRGNEKAKNKAYLLNFGGLAEWKRMNFSAALDRFQEGKKLSMEADDLIQAVKFNNNIALINAEIGNFTSSIKASKEMDAYTDKIEYLYTNEQFIRNKSNINFNLGLFYEKYFLVEKSRKYLLDSSEYYYKKALNYSKNLTTIKINTRINLGGVYYKKNLLVKAQNMYREVLFIAKGDNNLMNEYYIAAYNLGDLCFTQKKYDEALVYFKKVDSIYKVKKSGKLQFINSNYYQARIYNFYKNPDKAREHSRIYIENYEENELKWNDEVSEINLKLNHEEVNKEMIDMQKKYKWEIFSRYYFIGALILLFALILIIKSRRDKKRINDKVNAVVNTYRLQQEEEKAISMKPDSQPEKMTEPSKKESVTINIDEEKEQEILEKLAALEKKLYYLKPDFTQQNVAKKIKTNTTYLSYIVNKKFNKTFSEYSNELKINYAINEMISNPVYRKYSTQAIAESVGFKNAVSFTKSFNKRTGVTPVQFIKRLEN